MNMFKILGVVLIAGGIMTFGSEIGQQLSVPGAQQLVPTAEAKVGRPLTPVSVAGVGRRTVRRCAVGVYNCRLNAPQSTDSLIGQTSSESIGFKRHQASSSHLPENVQLDAAIDRSDLAAERDRIG
jgi:hypothetical protein